MGGFRAASWAGVVIVLVTFIPTYPSGDSSPVSPSVVPCPGITASSPQTLSTTPPPVPLSPCPGVVVETYLGGRGTDNAQDVAVDEFGYAYVVGSTNSTDFPTTKGATHHGKRDVFLAEFDPQGALVYSTLFGGSEDDSGASIAVDPSGNIFVTGSTQSTDFPTTPNAYDRTFNPGRSFGWRTWDAFVVKFDPRGSLVYSTFLGGRDSDLGTSIAVDASGHAFVTGETFSRDFPTTPGAYATGGLLFWFQSDVFVAKLNPEGTDLVFSTVIGGGDYDIARALAVDAEGSVHVAGETSSRDFPTTPGAFDPTPHGVGGVFDAFVFKLAPDGTRLVFSTYVGGEIYDQAFAIAVDSDGNAHVAGGTLSRDFPTTPGAYDRALGNGGEDEEYDAFVLGLGPTGDLRYSTFLGGTRPEVALAVSLDGSDSVHVAGGTASDDFPISAGAFDVTFNGFADVFVAKLERDGSGLNYSTYLGGGDDILYDPEPHHAGCQGVCEGAGWALAVDPTGNTTVVGKTPVADFPTTTNGFDPTLNGEDDAFLIRIELIPEPNRAPVAYFQVHLSSEKNGRITVNASNSADAEDADDLLEIRWDGEDDGVWDTTWSTAKTAMHDFKRAGTYAIRLEVLDTEGLVDSTTRRVVVPGPSPPLEVLVAPTRETGVPPLEVAFTSTVSGGLTP